MSRQIIKWFLIWFCLCVVPILLFIHFYSGFSVFDKEFMQPVILQSLVVLNLIYLTLLIKKIDLVYAVCFMMLFSLLCSLYVQFFNRIGDRMKFLQILIVEAVLTVIVHIILK